MPRAQRLATGLEKGFSSRLMRGGGMLALLLSLHWQAVQASPIATSVGMGWASPPRAALPPSFDRRQDSARLAARKPNNRIGVVDRTDIQQARTKVETWNHKEMQWKWWTPQGKAAPHRNVVRASLAVEHSEQRERHDLGRRSRDTCSAPARQRPRNCHQGVKSSRAMPLRTSCQCSGNAERTSVPWILI